MAAAADILLGKTSPRPSEDREFDLLLSCCADQHKPHDLSTVLKSPLNWERVLELAQHHRVFPALFTALQNHRVLPPAVQRVFAKNFQQHALKTLRFSAELKSILGKFAEHGIEVLAHKGLVLAQHLFGDPAMRQFGDLDFLMRPADVVRARVALQDLGYRPKLHLSPRQEKAYLHAGYEYVFGPAADPSLVEIQWRVVPRFYSVELDMEALFSRSREITFEGQMVRTLGKEDLMLVLCVHAAKHEWNQLGMIRDIAKLASFDLDWHLIEVEMRRLGILRIGLISLLLARNLLGFRIPHFKYDQAELSTSEKFANCFEQRLRCNLEESPESLRYFRGMIELRERWRDRVRFGWRLASTPNVGEWKSFDIPDSLFWLYRGARAGRLVGRLMRSSKN